MNRKNYKMTDQEKIASIKCSVSTPFTPEFYMITVDGDAVGHPLTQEQADLLIGWFNSVIFEYNEQEHKWDKF